MQTATINVRLPQSLKMGGDAVLRREGATASSIVRGVYEFLQQEQRLPEFLLDNQPIRKQEFIQKKREVLQSLIGVIPADVDLDALRQERLARHLSTGERR